MSVRPISMTMNAIARNELVAQKIMYVISIYTLLASNMAQILQHTLRDVAKSYFLGGGVSHQCVNKNDVRVN